MRNAFYDLVIKRCAALTPREIALLNTPHLRGARPAARARLQRNKRAHSAPSLWAPTTSWHSWSGVSARCDHVMHRSSTFSLFILVGAVVGERALDKSCNGLWQWNNKGVRAALPASRRATAVARVGCSTTLSLSASALI